MTGDQSTERWTPEFEGQRPPFTPGNVAALQHGAHSPRFVDPIATEMVALVDGDPKVTWLTAADRPALWAWARAEAQVQLLTEYLAKAAEATGDGVGDLDEDRVRAAYLLLHRAEARALSGRARLGLDPLSRARLGRDRAAGELDMARVMAELDRREREAERVSAERADEDDDEDGVQA